MAIDKSKASAVNNSREAINILKRRERAPAARAEPRSGAPPKIIRKQPFVIQSVCAWLLAGRKRGNPLEPLHMARPIIVQGQVSSATRLVYGIY